MRKSVNGNSSVQSYSKDAALINKIRTKFHKNKSPKRTLRKVS